MRFLAYLIAPIILIISSATTEAQIFRQQREVYSYRIKYVPIQLIQSQPVRSYVIPNVVTPTIKKTEQIVTHLAPPYPMIRQRLAAPKIIYSFEK